MRHLRISLALGLATVGLALPATAGAVTVNIGAVAPPAASGACAGCTGLQVQTDAASPSYTVPPGSWTVTSWSIQGGPTTTGNARLRIFRPVGMNYQLVAESAEESVVFGAERSFATSVPVQGGDLLGMRTGMVPGDIASLYATASANDIEWQAIGDPTIGQTVGPSGDITLYGINSPARANIAAVLFRPDPAVTPATPPVTPTATPPPRKKRKCKRHKRPSGLASAAKRRCKKKRAPGQA